MYHLYEQQGYINNRPCDPEEFSATWSYTSEKRILAPFEKSAGPSFVVKRAHGQTFLLWVKAQRGAAAVRMNVRIPELSEYRPHRRWPKELLDQIGFVLEKARHGGKPAWQHTREAMWRTL